MHIECLRAQHVRNLSDIAIEPGPHLNLFVGPNASGKTALLEAIYFLSRAKSFRTPRIKEVIQHRQQALLVTAEINHKGTLTKTGVEKTHGKTTIQYQGESVKRVSEQAKNLPLMLITPDSHTLVTGGPKLRRHWLDWSMFHVEPSYLDEWRSYHKALRQRNSLLKGGGLKSEQLIGWELMMVKEAELLAEQRQEFVEQLNDEMSAVTGNMLPFDVNLRFTKGWPSDQSLQRYLESGRGQDKHTGRTKHGAHRADVDFVSGEFSLDSVCSRGQMKLFVATLLLAQARLLEKKTGKRPIYLIDDFAAELDMEAREKFVSLMLEQQAQVFLTSTEMNGGELPWNTMKMFHVKRGEFTKVVK